MEKGANNAKSSSEQRDEFISKLKPTNATTGIHCSCKMKTLNRWRELNMIDIIKPEQGKKKKKKEKSKHVLNASIIYKRFDETDQLSNGWIRSIP